MIRVGVLASGRGSNLAALIAACAAEDFPAQIAVVVSDRPHAQALEHARSAGIPTEVVTRRDHPDREAHDAEVASRLLAHGVHWVVLAGYMRLLSGALISKFPSRILNIHPSLLPAFPGLGSVRQALDAGVRVTGCTVHVVDLGTDTGPIVAQAAVEVHQDDTVERLEQRVLAMEHQLLPQCVRWAAEGRLVVEGRTVAVNLSPGPATLLLMRSG